MGLFDDVKRKAVSDARSGKKYKEKESWEMSDQELDREIVGNKSIVAKRKYAEEKLKRK